MANLCIKTPSSASLVLIFQLLVLRPRPIMQLTWHDVTFVLLWLVGQPCRKVTCDQTCIYKYKCNAWRLIVNSAVYTPPSECPQLGVYNIKHNLARSCFQLWPSFCHPRCRLGAIIENMISPDHVLCEYFQIRVKSLASPDQVMPPSRKEITGFKLH